MDGRLRAARAAARPYLRKFGKGTIPDFVGDRYSETARLVAAVARHRVSFVYVAGQMSGVGLVFQRFLGVNTTVGVVIGMLHRLLLRRARRHEGDHLDSGGAVHRVDRRVPFPAFAISQQLTGIPVPQIGFGQILSELDGLPQDLGIAAYTEAFTTTSSPIWC